MDKMPCIPVKITDKKWADKLQDGSIFMRALHEYGSWSAIERAQTNADIMKSGVQGDAGEGIVRRVDPKIGDDFFNLFDPEVRAAMKDCMYIDNDHYQYYKVFCMYGLTYLLDEAKYEKPDERLEEFGDTAVVILYPDEFLKRVIKALHEKYGDNVSFRLDEVHYYPDDYYGFLDEFCKRASFAWQNEMRMRIALLDENNVIVGEDGLPRKRLVQDINPINLEIGDIRDISIQIPVHDLIMLNLPEIIANPIFQSDNDET